MVGLRAASRGLAMCVQRHARSVAVEVIVEASAGSNVVDPGGKLVPERTVMFCNDVRTLPEPLVERWSDSTGLITRRGRVVKLNRLSPVRQRTPFGGGSSARAQDTTRHATRHPLNSGCIERQVAMLPHLTCTSLDRTSRIPRLTCAFAPGDTGTHLEPPNRPTNGRVDACATTDCPSTRFSDEREP